MEEIKIRDEFIKLGQLLKLADMVQDGVEAKYVITDVGSFPFDRPTYLVQSDSR